MREETIPQFLYRNRERGPSGVAMRKKTFGIWKEYTWEQCYQAVKYLSLGFMSLGLKPGDKVCILGDCEPQWYWSEMAAQATGATVVGLFTDAIPSELEYIMNHSECKLVVAKDQEQVDKMLEIKEKTPHVIKVIYWDPAGLLNYDDSILTSFEAVQELGKEYEKAHPGAFENSLGAGKAEDLALLCYTSGTTGLPKAVMITHKNLTNNIKRMLTVLEVGEESDLYSVYPPAWVGEQVMGVGFHYFCGMRINFAEEPETVQEDMREICPTLTSMGPRQWESMASMIQARINDASWLKRLSYQLFLPVGYKVVDMRLKHTKMSLFWKGLGYAAYFVLFRPLRDHLGLNENTRYALTGGSFTGSDTFEFFRAMGLNIINSYGTSEVTGMATAHRSDDTRLETIGPPVVGVEIRLTDDGEILLGGSGLVQGYYKAPELTQKAFAGGWFHTGDAAVFTDDGHLVFLDRVSELGELSGGLKYSPTFIESKLKFSPYVKDVVVIGGKDKDFVTAIVNIDFENIGKWAARRGIPYTTFVDLSQKSETYELVGKEVARVNRLLPEHARIRRYVLLHKEFDPDEGELTRTRKLRRGYFADKYADLIGAIYSDKEQVEVEAMVKYRDGRVGKVKTQLRIKTAQQDGKPAKGVAA